MKNKLKSQIEEYNNNPLKTTEGFDIHKELENVLNEIGLKESDCGGKVTFKGVDPIVESPLRLATCASIGLAVKAVAVANIWKLRGGKGQDISIDLRKSLRRLSPFVEGKWEKLNGFAPWRPSDPFNPFLFDFYKTKDNKFVMPLNPYPGIKSATLQLLGCDDSKKSVAYAISKWNGAELEEAGEKVGIVMPLVRTVDEFLNEETFDILSKTNLIEIEKIGESDPEPLTKDVSSPLENIRALGMGQIIAGAGFGRALALHGADCLNIWRPSDFEFDSTYYTANVGVRSCTLNPETKEGRKKFNELLRGADIFYVNRRPALIRRLGVTAEDCAQIRPGIIHCSVTLNGEVGPWVNRGGFDQTAGSITGVMALEGTEHNPKLPPIKVVNDYVLSWLLAAGALKALERRAKEGGSYKVHISLTRVSMWLLSLGIFDKEFVANTVNSTEEHTQLEPDLFTAKTPCGEYQGVTEQVEMSETPGEYKTVLVPRGSCEPKWLDK
ncbi:MAG: CoA transferase [Sarcina sp.]